MTVNVPLLTKILDHVVAHPDEWNQKFWATRTECGTAYCIAGHAVVMSGYEANWSTSCPGHNGTVLTGELTNGERVSERAAELLGIEFEDGRDPDEPHLFDAHNTLRDIYEHANYLTDGEIPIPDTLPDGS